MSLSYLQLVLVMKNIRNVPPLWLGGTFMFTQNRPKCTLSGITPTVFITDKSLATQNFQHEISNLTIASKYFIFDWQCDLEKDPHYYSIFPLGPIVATRVLSLCITFLSFLAVRYTKQGQPTVVEVGFLKSLFIWLGAILPLSPTFVTHVFPMVICL